MRDAQSKLDQVIAFTGNDDHHGRCCDGAGPRRPRPAARHRAGRRRRGRTGAFALAARAVEMGYDLRAVCRELTRVVRDLLVLSVDPSRINDPGDRGRRRARAPDGARQALLARGSAARVRSARARRSRHPRRRAAALSPRDGAASVDSSAEARADRGSDRRDGTGSATDSAIDKLAEVDIEPLFVLLGSPSWANGVPADVPEHQQYVPAEPKRFATWLSAFTDFAYDEALEVQGTRAPMGDLERA